MSAPLSFRTMSTKSTLFKFLPVLIANRRNLTKDVRIGFVGMVGRTPLIRLNKLSEDTGCDVMVKAEFASGGGSVKDRAALYLVKEAVDNGTLRKGGTVVEGTAGNTGIGIAHICNAMGFKSIFFLPNNQSQEKIDALTTLGAEVHQVPVVPWDDENNYNHQARRFAEERDNTIWTDQFDNRANRQAHIETTGPEIWQQTGGEVDAVVFATGTGGTLSGVSSYLKSVKPTVKAYVADPQGSVLYNYFTHGKLERTEGSSVAEGIGQGRLTNNLKGAPLDGALHILDVDAVNMTFRLLEEEGFFVGVSSGVNVSAAEQVAKMLGPGHTIVTCLCDGGQRYYNRVFSRSWLESKGLLGALSKSHLRFLH